MTMNSDSVVKGFDVFKNQVVCVSVILNVKTVKPFPFYEWMEGFNAGIVIKITFMWITALHVFDGFTPYLWNILSSEKCKVECKLLEKIIVNYSMNQ